MNKRMKRTIKILSVILALVLLAGLAGCAGKKPEKEKEQEKEQVTRTFTDSVGRTVELPTTVTSVAPSGPLAQLVLYTACKEQLAGIAAEFTEVTAQYIDKKYVDLPVFGQFYGKNANLNMEALIAEAPDVIVDIGEPKETIKEDMDALQAQLNIPVVFIESSSSTMDKTYEKLGELTGETKKAKELGDYCAETIDLANEATDKLEDVDRKSVYLALGENGLRTNAKGSFHSEILELIGANNVAEVEVVSKGEGSEVSYEQVATWNPEYILTYRAEVYDMITKDVMWAELDAVKNKKVYQVPVGPYNFISDPPSVNRMIGIHWLGNLLYPDAYDFSEKDVKEFTKDFYHVDLSDEQVKKILMNAK